MVARIMMFDLLASLLPVEQMIYFSYKIPQHNDDQNLARSLILLAISGQITDADKEKGRTADI